MYIHIFGCNKIWSFCRADLQGCFYSTLQATYMYRAHVCTTTPWQTTASWWSYMFCAEQLHSDVGLNLARGSSICLDAHEYEYNIIMETCIYYFRKGWTMTPSPVIVEPCTELVGPLVTSSRDPLEMFSYFFNETFLHDSARDQPICSAMTCCCT